MSTTATTPASLTSPAATRHAANIRRHGWRIACAVASWQAAYDLEAAADVLAEQFPEAATDGGSAIGEAILRMRRDAAEQLESAMESITPEELEDALGL